MTEPSKKYFRIVDAIGKFGILFCAISPVAYNSDAYFSFCCITSILLIILSIVLAAVWKSKGVFSFKSFIYYDNRDTLELASLFLIGSLVRFGVESVKAGNGWLLMTMILIGTIFIPTPRNNS